ncbi:TRAP transporter small permease [Marinobacterium aestuariivivens]|uniref:TRAP transporter small permease protein n=1 Tax=Marinobacterium aestuariivivens TaxID=1698799 RepID=A0ABW1ZZ50_9GAMM
MKDLYKKLLAWATGGSLFIVFAVVLVASMSRYLLNYSIQWSDEVARYAMIYGAMFGSTLCYMDDTHIKFGFMEKISGSLKSSWTF